MVSIRKAKQGFQLRKRQKGVDRETLGLLAGGLCCGVFLVVVYNSIFATNPNDPSSPEMLLRRNAKPHPVLTTSDINNNKQQHYMSDGFNAMALDILETLDCESLFQETLKQLQDTNSNTNDDFNGGGGGGGGGGGAMMDDNALNQGFIGENVQRRRLEQQHGDDGGFDNPGAADAAAAAAAAEVDGKDDDPNDDGEKWGANANAGGGGAGDDAMPLRDDVDFNGGAWAEITAKHLFCLAASQQPPQEIVKEVVCDASGQKRQTLLDLWSAARAQISSSQDIHKILELTKERKYETLLGTNYNLWAPDGDEGLTYMLATLNSDQNVDNGGIHGLQQNLGPGKLFVDVGSCLGTTVLAIQQQYPGTKIVSLEPASPNWLLQELNLRCNLDSNQLHNIKIVLAGVGPNNQDEDNLMAKLMWRPTATTSTRAWTPSEEHRNDDMELVVRLRRLHSILAEADAYDQSIDVLNVDCEGCEYNLIPALTQDEFEDIPTVMGGVHWGYIPTNKLPSSARAKTTHERLCQHENIARTTKECCAYPDLKVRSSNPGEVLVQDRAGFPPKDSTVADVVAEGLCDDFDSWAAQHYLFDVKDDWGWFELSSQA